MDASFFERLKTQLKAALPVSGDAVQVYAGLACYLVICLAFRRPLTWGWALLPGLCVSLVVEGLEILDHYGVSGLARLSAREAGATVLRHLRDVITFNLAPFLVFLVAHYLERLTPR